MLQPVGRPGSVDLGRQFDAEQAQGDSKMNETQSTDRVSRTPLEDAKACFDTRSCLFVDVRSPDQYEQSHIPGALSIPLHGPPEAFSSLPRDQQIIFYCT